MKFQDELPQRGNRRGGPGWWMDDDGVWRSPEEWPEDTPPLAGWIRRSDGRWEAADATSTSAETVELTVDDMLDLGDEPAVPPTQAAPVRSRQAKADIRSMLLLAGAVAAVMLALAGALVLINRAGAAGDEQGSSSSDTSGVIFPPETESDVLARRTAIAAEAPARARTDLEGLASSSEPPEAAAFDETEWSVPDSGCLSDDEQVLIARSSAPVGFADQIECVPATGAWFDRYQGQQIRRTIDAEVSPIVPPSEAYRSGGWNWTPSTRLAFLTDLEHLANLQVIAAGSGHNPRSLSPDEWRPAQERTWCAYAVDWIAVKSRWDLGVSDSERAALVEMLDTCDDGLSDGADPATMLLDPLMAPEIGYLTE